MSALKTILKSFKLQDYILNTSAFPREHAQLKGLREATYDKFGQRALIGVPADEGQLLAMLLKIMNAKRTLEVGVFTGYSLLTTALALPHDGQITAIDISKEDYELGLPFIKNAHVEHKINFIQSDALKALEELLDHVRNGKMEHFDFVFVDADKERYHLYHEKVIEMVRMGGVIAYDNTLWYGYVAEEDSEIEEPYKERTMAVRQLNKCLASDPRAKSPSEMDSPCAGALSEDSSGHGVCWHSSGPFLYVLCRLCLSHSYVGTVLALLICSPV